MCMQNKTWQTEAECNRERDVCFCWQRRCLLHKVPTITFEVLKILPSIFICLSLAGSPNSFHRNHSYTFRPSTICQLLDIISIFPFSFSLLCSFFSYLTPSPFQNISILFLHFLFLYIVSKRSFFCLIAILEYSIALWCPSSFSLNKIIFFSFLHLPNINVFNLNFKFAGWAELN